MMNKSFLRENAGLLCLIAAQLCISINIVVNKYLITHASTLVLLTLRFVFSTVFLVCFLQLRNKSFSFSAIFQKLTKRDKASLVVQGLFGGFLFNILMLNGLKITSATMAGIISSAVPVFILFFSFLILKEKIAKHEYISIAIATMGILFINISKVSTYGVSLNIWGDLLILIALFPEALYTIVAKWHPVEICPIEQTTIVNFVNAVAFSITMLMFPSDIYTLSSVSLFDWFLIIAVLSSAGFLFFLLWNIGLTKSSTQQASIVTSVVPVGACILAVIFLNEHIHLYELVGIGMVVAAIYIGANKKIANYLNMAKSKNSVSDNKSRSGNTGKDDLDLVDIEDRLAVD